jgi:hypothetical protein
MMRTPTARHRTVDPWSPLCGVTGEVRRLAPLARIVTKRRPDEPRIVGGKVIICPPTSKAAPEIAQLAVIEVISDEMLREVVEAE